MSTGVPAPAGAPVVAFGAQSAPTLLAGLLGEPVEVRQLCPACGSTDHGRPWLILSDGRRPDVSIAHAGDVTLVAVSWSGRVGVDLAESTAAPPPGIATLADWVRFEALAKATGEGLRRAPDSTRPPEAHIGVLDLGGWVAGWCVLPARGRPPERSGQPPVV